MAMIISEASIKVRERKARKEGYNEGVEDVLNLIESNITVGCGSYEQHVIDGVLRSFGSYEQHVTDDVLRSLLKGIREELDL